MRKSIPRLLKKIAIFVSALFVCVILLQLVLGILISQKIDKSLSEKVDAHYIVEIDRTKVNLFTMSVILKRIKITPDSLILYGAHGEVRSNTIGCLQIPVMRLRNFDLLNFYRTKTIDLSEIVIKDAEVLFYIDKKYGQSTTSKTPRTFSGIALDSIPIKGIGGVEIGAVSFKNSTVGVIDIRSMDTIFSSESLTVQMNKMRFTKNSGTDETFCLKMGDIDIIMADERFPMPGGDYFLAFDELYFKTEDSTLTMRNVEYKPINSCQKMAAKAKYQEEYYAIEVGMLSVTRVEIKRFIRTGDLYLSNVKLEDMVLDIYKDQRKPFDESRRPKLPNTLLNTMLQPIYIDSITIENSSFVYSERHDKIKQPMVLTLADMDVKIRDITSIDQRIAAGAELTVDLTAKMQKKLPLQLSIQFPLASITDTFSFQGNLQSGDFKLFNSILLPVLGMEFESGKLDNMEFSARANLDYALGEMTMCYHDLKGSVSNLKKSRSNKLFSWVVNAVIIQNNPVGDNPVKSVPLYAERVPYKGLGNYIWKTAQSGIMGTVVPAQKSKVQLQSDTRQGVSKKQIRQRERLEKKRLKSEEKRAEKE